MTTAIMLMADKVLKGTEGMDSTQITAMTIIGLAVVFSALLILVTFLYISGGIFKKAKKKQQPAAEKKPAPKPAAPAKPKPAKAVPAPAAEDDSEVIAVIMAAIAAMGAADGKTYALKSVKRVTRGGSGRSAWAQAGLSDLTTPF